MIDSMKEVAATKSDIDQLSTSVRGDIDGVITLMRDFMVQVDQRFTVQENKFDRLEKEMIDLKKSHDKLLNTIDAFIGRIDTYETELAARDSQFEKLLTWARKVSEKTGIPLENL